MLRLLNSLVFAGALVNAFVLPRDGADDTAAAASAASSGTPITESQLRKSYDYVIVGGGVAGLTLANRLSADSSTYVLVIEAGPLDKGDDFITIPGLAANAVGTVYDWNLTYAANPAGNIPAVSVAQGKVVGGGSVINRLLFERAPKADYDRWGTLVDSSWSWSSLLPYFKKSEHSTPPSASIASTYGVGYTASTHGTSGPVAGTYSPWFWPSTATLKKALKQLGLTIPVDGNAGTAVGGVFMTHAQDPVKETRVSARIAYWNPVSTRKNFHLLTSHQVTRLLTKASTVKATVWGVEFAASSSSTRLTVNVTGEAIVSAGTLHSPQVLQLSGIGDPALLSQYGIQSVVNLPAVGQNLHDHPYVVLVTTTNLTLSTNNLTDPTFAAQAMAEYQQNRTGPYSTATGDMIAFLPVTNFTNASTAASWASQVNAQSASQYLDASTPSSVVTGFGAQKSALAAAITDKTGSAFLEIIYGDGVYVMGLLHPLSRGSVKINSADPFTPATFDARFLTNPFDTEVLVNAVRYARTLYSTPAMQSIASFEVAPGTATQSDADIEAYIRAGLGTLWHPAGSCKAGSQASGGVVNKNFQVYGTSNLRVVDASVFPIVPGTHTQWSVYALAEMAADVILQNTQ